jgi:hypothetical protein
MDDFDRLLLRGPSESGVKGMVDLLASVPWRISETVPGPQGSQHTFNEQH